MFSVAAAFVVVLGAGDWISRNYPAAARNSDDFGFLVAIALVSTAFALFRMLAIPIRMWNRRYRRGSPISQTSVPTPPQLKLPSPHQKSEYAKNASMTITCPHLNSIERAMRDAGVPLVATAQIVVKAACRVDERTLLRDFTPFGPVRYSEYFIAERSPEDIPVAYLECGQCASRIDVLHPVECRFSTRWFPSAPPALALAAKHHLSSVGEISAIACAPSERYAAIAAGTHRTPQNFAIWDTAEAKALVDFQPYGIIRSIAWSARERILATGRGVLWSGGPATPGPSLSIWDATTGAELLRFGSDLFGVRGVALSRDDRFLLASGMLGETPSSGSTLDLWDVATGRLSARVARIEPDGSPFVPVFEGVAFTADGTLALAACSRYTIPPAITPAANRELPARWNRGIRAWSVATGQEVDFLPQYTPVDTISVSTDGTRLFFAGQRFGLWNLTNRTMLWDKQSSHNTAAASPDCTLIARGTGYQVDNHGPYEDTGVELFNGANGAVISVGVHSTPVTALSITSDGTRLVAGGEKGELRFWRSRLEGV
jgi:hypothetical protein